MLLSLHLALQAINFSDVDDAELVAMYLDTRSERYFAELYRRYSSKVFGKCYSMLSDEAEAHDMVQDIFERVLNKLSSFRRDSSFSTWLYAITNNFCIDRLRRRSRDKVSSIDPVEMPQLAAEEAEDDSWLEMQSPAAIEHILSEIGEMDRMVLILMYMDDLSIREIADTLGLQESATKMRLKRARDRAKKIYLNWSEQPEILANYG